VLGLCLVMAFGVLDPLGASRARADVATLKKIASKVEPLMGIVTIEASDPVAYVASQPDPLTFVLELRDVVSAGYADQFKAHPGHPVSAVRVESTHAPDGGELARVHLTLTQPIRPRVKSSRNVISVEADRAPTAEATVNLGGAVAAIRDVRVTRRGDATAITLLATGRLAASGVQEETKGSRRLLIDLPNTSSAVKSITTINEGPVGTVRIGANPKSPLLTQVAMDLSRPSTYRLESSPDGTSLTVVFDEPAVDPVAALRAAPAAKTAVAPVAPAPTAAPVVVPAAARGAARAPQATATDSSPAPKYTGHPVSLDFQGADLRAVLRTFAEISGLNIVIDPTISGSVDVALRDVPWDQALDIILRSNRLGYVVDGTIVRVAPLDTLANEEKERLKLVDAQAQAGELRVLTRALSYATTKDLAKLLEETVLSNRGTIQEHVPTNTLIINDLSDRLERASALIAVLDVPPPQVEIEARIVQTTREFARTLGVQWGFNARAALGDSLDAFSTGATGRLQPPAGLPGPGNVVGTAVNLATGGATSALAVALTGAVNLDIALSALEKQGQGRILSTPRVSTQNNIEAEITQGIQIPIQTVANNTVTVTFKDAALTLRVKPQITASNTVIMQISVENAAPDFSRQVNFIPPIDTQRANTRVLVNNGETTVIGGIYVSREQALQDRTPGVHRVPILGWLFKRDSIQDENRELLIFITPRIMQI
jgi:type IV pilus assembly protein PilQ